MFPPFLHMIKLRWILLRRNLLSTDYPKIIHDVFCKMIDNSNTCALLFDLYFDHVQRIGTDDVP